MDEKYVKRRYFSLKQPGSLYGFHTFNVHRQVRRKFQRRIIVCPFINYLWQSDTIYNRKYKHQNRVYAYILLCVDCFSKKLYCEPMKNKDGGSTRVALKSIFKREKAVPSLFMTDKGTEY
jgi:hypothetical protein